MFPHYPDYVKACFARLALGGHPAFLVGGCVRDRLMGRVPGDYDMATPATPEQVMALFPRAVPTGLRHGTVTVVLEGGQIEVTTFRTEGGYTDGRHPDRVRFVTSLEQDLARRDFTVNAMALGASGRVYDPFSGRADLRRRQLRCVGNPVRRFQEDGLRMLRGIRLAAQLGFSIEEHTLSAMAACASGTARLSAERVGAEVEKTLLAPWPEWGNLWFPLGLLDGYAPLPSPVDLRPLKALPREAGLRWAGFWALLHQAGAAPSAEELTRSLRRPGAVIRACAGGAALLAAGLPSDASGWRRALAEYGPEAARAAAAMGDALEPEGHLRVLALAQHSGCWQVGGLALSGADLHSLGLRGPAIGLAQRRLLEHVLTHPEDNTPQRRREVLASHQA